MADEDEVDVLSDFTLDNYLDKTNSNLYESSSLVSQNSEFLDCNYTIHPQWLLDKPSANPESWYDATSMGLTPNSSAKQPDLTPVSHYTVGNSITDESGWTENEKSLLQRGIEIFDKNAENLSQFIGSKTPNEVKYYLDQFYSEVQSSSTIYCDAVIAGNTVNEITSEVLTDLEIPTSIEEVIDTISTGKPTVKVLNRKKPEITFDKPKFSSKLKYQPYSKNFKNMSVKNTFHKNLTAAYNQWKGRKPKDRMSTTKHSKFKIKTQLNVKKKSRQSVNVKQKTMNFLRGNNKRLEIGKAEITTGTGLSVPLCEGEEIVKLKKENSDDDSDIDLEIDVDDTEHFISQTDDLKRRQMANINCDQMKQTTYQDVFHSNIKPQHSDCTELNIDLTSVSESTVEQLKSMDIPTEECVMDSQEITEIEKIFNADFFDASVSKKSAKTPERYLKIRNHILNAWETNRPSYITKTSLRQGLRNCGDVNCIGRIHFFLEQIGAINFSCTQVTYSRPLLDVLRSSVKEKTMREGRAPEQIVGTLGPRQRAKKKFINDGEGGCTLTHDEKGDVIDTTIVDEKPVMKKFYTRKPTIGLIACRSFSKDESVRYRLVVKLSALLAMDYHAHSSLSEVMGLVAGYWDRGRRTVTLCTYQPCRNLASSATHCEMCPVSQANAAEAIAAKGLQVLGWFHSHPTFPPEPSRQDLATQLSLQRNLGRESPCIGVILSPFHEPYNASQLRCLVVVEETLLSGGQPEPVPYKLRAELRAAGCDPVHLLDELWAVRSFLSAQRDVVSLDFRSPLPGHSHNTLLQKYMENLKIHLSKFSDLQESMSKEILASIHDMFNM